MFYLSFNARLFSSLILMGCATPSANLKCIVFTLALDSGYLYLPRNSPVVLAFLLYLPYLVMAWYDYAYSCQRKFGPTFLSLFYMWAKPKNDEQYKKYSEWCPKYKKIVLLVDLLLLVSLGLLAKFPPGAFSSFNVFLPLFAIFASSAVFGGIHMYVT